MVQNIRTFAMCAVHVLVNVAECPYKCSGDHAYNSDVCNKSFRGNHSFAAQQDVLSGKHLQNCNVCKKSFNYKIALNVHLPVYSGGCP
jgi:hypothetical protein